MSRKIKAKRRNPIAAIMTMILLAGLIFLAGIAIYLGNANNPINSANTDLVNIEIPKGSSTEAIASILAENNLIESVLAFKIKSRIEGYDATYKSGFYKLSQSMSMEDMMISLQKGTALTVRFTIPEGFDIRKITEKLASEQLIDPAEFSQQIIEGYFDYRFLADAPAGSERLEGFLYPDTYEVFPDSEEAQIIDKMLARFDAVFTEEYYLRADELGMTVEEVITLSSIIEREARIPEDRPLISSVFHNRIAVKMPLQSCATVQFILGDQKAKLTNKDIAIDSPYNTYIIPGLPPGPICSPGLDSIKAALYPAETDYMYFLAKGDGSSVFSVTYEDFLKNKEAYID